MGARFGRRRGVDGDAGLGPVQVWVLAAQVRVPRSPSGGHYRDTGPCPDGSHLQPE